MLQVIGAAPGTQTDVDWPRVWRDSAAKREVKAELRRMKVSGDGGQIGSLIKSNVESGTFAASYSTQFIEVTKRVARFYWRNPAYIYSKLVLVVATVSLESNEPESPLIRLIFSIIHTTGSFYRVFLLQDVRNIPARDPESDSEYVRVIRQYVEARCRAYLSIDIDKL